MDRCHGRKRKRGEGKGGKGGKARSGLKGKEKDITKLAAKELRTNRTYGHRNM